MFSTYLSYVSISAVSCSYSALRPSKVSVTSFSTIPSSSSTVLTDTSFSPFETVSPPQAVRLQIITAVSKNAIIFFMSFLSSYNSSLPAWFHAEQTCFSSAQIVVCHVYVTAIPKFPSIIFQTASLPFPPVSHHQL